MAWQPIRPKQTGPSPFMRAVISRCTMGVVGLALLFGGYKCISVSLRLSAEAKEMAAKQQTPISARTTRRMSGAGLPMLIGIGLAGLGVIAVGGAVLPQSAYGIFVRPPRDDF